ncbi:MAG: peptidase MA domain-containing protein [Chloroflexi bacterium]|nr:peptidase MA domain-containing protein [Chloroflexota bacterium]
MKKLSVLFILITLFSMLPVPAAAANGLTVTASAAEVNFPSSINFSLSATSGAVINDIRLHYRLDRLSFAEVESEVYIDFPRGTSVQAKWQWDMRRTGGLPPGALIEYWWSLKDASGNRFQTKPASVQFNDNRYPWRSLTRGLVTLYWYQGDESFGLTLLTAADEAVKRLTTPATQLDRPIRIYIYASSRDLQGSMIFPQEWTGGVSFSEYAIVGIGVATNQLDWGIRTISHELTHVVAHQLTRNPYNELPMWLNEGLAMYNEGKLDPQFAGLLSSAIQQKTLITVRSLSSPFSAFSAQASLAYAESYSVVEYLINTYGQDKLTQLLGVFREGSTYDDALRKVYGFDMDGLNREWVAMISAPPKPAQKTVLREIVGVGALGVA